MKTNETKATAGYYVSKLGLTGQTCIRQPRGTVCAMEAGNQQTREDDAALIVKAVNEHEALNAVAEAASGLIDLNFSYISPRQIELQSALKALAALRQP